MTTGKTIALTRWTFVDKVMSLLFNMLSRLVVTFLPRSKHLLIKSSVFDLFSDDSGKKMEKKRVKERESMWDKMFKMLNLINNLQGKKKKRKRVTARRTYVYLHMNEHALSAGCAVALPFLSCRNTE